jgi:predicted GIY-YIG superfamily endonuclease
MSSSSWQIHIFHLVAYEPNTLWVGVSWWSPEQRLQQHLTGIHSSSTVRRGKPELAPEHYEQLPTYHDRQQAEEAADELVIELQARGYRVLSDPNRLARTDAIAL